MTGHVRISLAAWGAVVLGSVVLTPVFSGRFLFVSAMICAVVTGAGILLQHIRTPAPLVPVMQLLVLEFTLALIFLPSTLRFGLIPWRETVSTYNSQLVDALDAINRFSAPLPPTESLTIFAATMIGLTGLAVHLIAVQIRQAAWAGLLLLMMYTVPAATVHDGLPAWLFVPPAAGYIVLLSAEGRSRLSRWGRRISGIAQLDAAEPVEASALGQAGRRIGMTVIAVAVVLPALMPSLPEGVFGNGLGGSGSGGGGGGASVGRNPIVDMGENLRRGPNVTALSYTGSGPTYLRLAALDLFDGEQWRVSPRPEGVDVNTGTFVPPPGLSKDTAELPQLKYTVNVNKSWRSQWVPVPYPARSLSIDHKWRYHPATLDIQSASGRSVTGLKYSVAAYDVQPSEAELRNSINTGQVDEYTHKLPRNVPARIGLEAERITKAAAGNPYQQAVLLQRYFRDADEFTYSLENSAGSGIPALMDFLFEDRTGYCEQFGTAMALMARTLGIPARVAIGFLSGQASEDGRYTVRTHDMHLWPELYFSDIGWVRFEPTPAQRSGRAPDYSIPAGGEPTDGPSATPTANSTDSTATPEDPDRGPNQGRDAGETGVTGPTDTGGWWSTTGLRWAVGLVLVLLVLGVPWAIRTLVRRRRFTRSPDPAGVEALWAEIRDTVRDVGLTWSDTATPRQIGDRLIDRLPTSVRPQVIRLARGVEAVRYAGEHGIEHDLRTEAKVVRQALWSAASSGQRWRARLLPPSWRWYLNRGSAEASDLLDQFDLALARLRSSLLPRRS